MNTFNNKLFDILSGLIDIIVNYNVLERDPGKRKTTDYFLKCLHNTIVDDYWRDPHYEKLCEVSKRITGEKISECIRLYLKEHNYIEGLKFFSKLCGCSEDVIAEFSILYQNSIISTDEDDEDISSLKAKIKELELELEELRQIKRFTKDNITEVSVRYAKVVFNKEASYYSKSYSCIDELLKGEGISLSPTVKNGYSGIANILKSRVKYLTSKSKYVCFGNELEGYRIDFYFE